MSESAREWYEDGVADHYRRHGDDYRNPHEPVIVELVAKLLHDIRLDTARVLDLAAGAGELTRAIRSARPGAEFAGIDPFTGSAYQAMTGIACEAITFEQIAGGALGLRQFTLVGCSFAMHLCPPTMLAALCVALAQAAPTLLILTPHKRPSIVPSMGFVLEHELVHRRVRARVYRSNLKERVESQL
jgi:SAM-dependent methyltransferase